MKFHQLQIDNIKTVQRDSMVQAPQGTPTVGLIRKEKRPRNYGLMTVDCLDEAELVDMACFLVARNQIVKTLEIALDFALGHAIDVNAIREIEAALFMATGHYAPGAGPHEPIAIDTWRRRNGMAPKYGHLTEAEIRMHVKAMDEHAKRAYDPNEPFESQLRRYVQQLQEDSKQWDTDEARAMGGLLRELEAGYVLDRGETAHMGVASSPPKPDVAREARTHDPGQHYLAPGEKAVDEL